MKEKIYIPIKINENDIQISDDNIKEIEKNLDKKILLELVHEDFTSINIQNQKNILAKINETMQKYKIYGIKITSSPDSVDKKNLKFLKKFKVKEIELKIESSNDYILKQIGADFKFEYAKKIAKQIKFLRFALGITVTIGLPESTALDDLNTVKQSIGLKPIHITLIPCQINYNNEVKKLFDENDFEPLSKVQLIERLKESIKLISNAKIKSISIGYEGQHIDDVDIEDFRDLIASDMWYDRIVEMIKSYNVKVKVVEIEVNEADINIVKGIDNCNLNKLKEVYDVELQISKNDKIDKGNYKMKILKTYTDFLDEDN